MIPICKNINKFSENVITASLEELHTLSTKDTEKLILVEKTKIGTGLEISEGGIKIGKGIKSINISSQVTFFGINADDIIVLYIYKNNKAVEIVEEKSTGFNTLAFSGYQIDVEEGDIIYLCARNRTNAVGTISPHTFLTVSAIKEDIKLSNPNLLIVEDTGWVDLELGDGITIPTVDKLQTPLQARRIGKQVYLRGIIKGVSAKWQAITTLPKQFRPASYHTYINPRQNKPYITDLYKVSPSGVIMYGLSANFGEAAEQLADVDAILLTQTTYTVD